MATLNSFISYLFAATPGHQFKFYIPLIVLSALLIIGALFFAYIYKEKKKIDPAFRRLFKKLSSRMTMFGFLFLTLVAIRYENIPYFAMRFWLYLVGVIFLYVAYKFLYAYIKVYPKENQSTHFVNTKKETKVYLPSKKKK
ncbi:MAG: hypothetical protein WC806_03020 [Candidatus Gracilibacteria bacterium]|jgi:amino acid transporter